MIIEIYGEKEQLLYTLSTRWFNYNYTTKTLFFINCTKSGAGVFEYIETFYNTVRIHSHCDYMSPNDFEKLYERVMSLPAA